MGDEYPQKRRFPRIPSENAVLVRKLSELPVEGFATMKTVGLGGCMFVHGRSLGVGTELELLIPVEDRVIQTRARVVYERPKTGTRVEVGAEFLDIPEEDRAALQSALSSSGEPADA